MASRFPYSEPSLDPDAFTRAKIVIESTFQSLIQKLVERRDQLLVELHQMKVDFISKEETRRKYLNDLDQLITGLEQASIEQNLIVKKQKEHIRRIKQEKLEFISATPIPLPQFIPSNLKELKESIEMYGKLEEIAGPYNTKLHPVKSIGKKGNRKTEFNGPHGVAIDDNGNMYFADSKNNRVQVISFEGQFIKEIGKGDLGFPYSLSVYKECLFVTDFNLSKVFKYKLKNSKLECKSEILLNRPLGITVADDEVYVADLNNNRIAVISFDLKFIKKIRNDKLVEPRDVKVNMNKVFVANNSKPHNVLVFSKSGDLLNSIISLIYGTSDLFLCFDKLNNILVSDNEGQTVQIFTLEGQLLHSIECDYSPTGIALTQDNTIICVDCDNSSVHFY